MATLILPGMPPVRVRPRNGHDFDLAELYALLDCEMVEYVTLLDADGEPTGEGLWIDEEGKYTRPGEVNGFATGILRRSGGIPGDYIAGRCLLTEDGEVE